MKKRCLSRFKEKKWVGILFTCLLCCFIFIAEFFVLNKLLTIRKGGGQNINASVITKYNEKEIIVYSDTTCFFNLVVSVCDGETSSQNSYGEFQISEGEILTLTLEDLAPGFFSDEAIITDVDAVYDTYVKNFSLFCDTYSKIDCSLLVKYSEKEITVFSDKSCFFDLYVATKDDDFNSSNSYRKIKIKEGETITLTLEDLSPGFFTDSTKISYVGSNPKTYKKS